VLLIWGSSDVFGTPKVAQEVARLIPNAEVRLIAGGGHVCWIGHTSEVAAAALPFLRMQSRAR
jgi:pimeloyl-ACP methyl ester carboxylesterase